MTNRAQSLRAALILSTSAAVLAACASKLVPPPEVSYDTADFKAAAIEKPPEKPVKIVEVPKPLPLPGQLQPDPGKVVEDKRSPEERVADANKRQRSSPRNTAMSMRFRSIPLPMARSISSTQHPSA
ncbi:hypothetical protein ACVOMV_18540 [Mesorhizobium atlanticum]